MSECIERRLKTAGLICDNREHCHPERSPRAHELDFGGCVRALQAMCAGMSDGNRLRIAAFFTGKTTQEIARRERQTTAAGSGEGR